MFLHQKYFQFKRQLQSDDNCYSFFNVANLFKLIYVFFLIKLI
jgi:hypothetical protein